MLDIIFFIWGINVGAFYAPFAAAGIKSFLMNNFGATLAQGYNAGFGIASIGMIFSLIIFTAFRKYYQQADYQSKKEVKVEKDVVLTKQQEKERIIALLTVFGIVIFLDGISSKRRRIIFICKRLYSPVCWEIHIFTF